MRGMLVGAALALLGLALGLVLGAKVDAAAEAKWWDLMTAFGTVGAVASALYFSLQERIRLGAQERAEVIVIRGQLVPELGSFAALTIDFHIVLSRFLRDPSSVARLGEHQRDMLSRWVEHSRLPVCSRLEARLFRLPTSEAKAIADVLGRIPRIHGLVQMARSVDRTKLGSPFIEADLRTGLLDLEHVCRSLSVLAAAWPSDSFDAFTLKRLNGVA